MTVGGGKGEEEDVPEGMPPVAPSLLPIFRLGGWTVGGGVVVNLEDVSLSPGHQVDATLLKDVWILQE